MRLLVLIVALVMTGAGCAHAPRPESQVHVIAESAEGVGSALGSGGAGGHDCQKEHEECIERCWKKRYPWPHNKPQSGWYHERCEHDCNEEFKKCEEEQEEVERARREKLKFSRMEEAIDWIRNHKAEVALGTVVIVAGVAFVLTTGGTGALILVPVALSAG